MFYKEQKLERNKGDKLGENEMKFKSKPRVTVNELIFLVGE